MAENRGKMLKFIWKLENYSYCWNKANEFLQSPSFEMAVFEGSSWCLKLYPRGVSSYGNYVSVYLERLDSSKGPLGITVDYEISILRPDGTAEYVKETKNRNFRKGHAFGFNLVTQEEILGRNKSIVLPEDILTVQCYIFPKGAQLKKCTEIITKTHLEVERFIFLWKPENCFSERLNEFYSLELFQGRKDLNFKLYRPSFNNIEYVNVLLGTTMSNVKAFRFRVHILDSNDSISPCLLDKYYFHHYDKDEKLISAAEIQKQKSLYLKNEKLTLHCDLTVSFGLSQSQIEVVACDNIHIFPTVHTKPEASSETDTLPKSHSCSCSDNDASFKNDFQNLYQEGTLCDFTLKVKNENIQAHKFVLGARSPVFKAMLTSNMKENEKNMVDISDLDADTIRHMLTFMYTDTTNNLDWEMAGKLYFAADKYDIMGLKRICSNALERNLRVSNVGEALTLANLHGDDELRNLTLEFISTHDTEVICSTEWKAFMAEEVHLAAETMRLIFMKKAENNGGKTELSLVLPHSIS